MKIIFRNKIEFPFKKQSIPKTTKGNSVSKPTYAKDNGLGGQLDTETHDYYEIDCKDNSDLEFNYIYVEADFKFIESYSLIYVFE